MSVMRIAKRLAIKIPIVPKLRKKREDRKRKNKEIRDWIANDRPLPPPHAYKERVVLEYAKKLKSAVLVETGTYLGEMIEAVKSKFKNLVSIEIDPKLHEAARKKFGKDKKIKIVLGDSAHVLPGILDSLVDQRIIFWLDGHYSGGITGRSTIDTPIRKELESILNHRGMFVLLIDDARFFTGKGDYPSIEELQTTIRGKCPNMLFSVQNDIIRIHNDFQ